jgi:hypothetical protein
MSRGEDAALVAWIRSHQRKGMERQTLAGGPEKAAGLSRTTILLLAGFMGGMTAGVPAPYATFCVAVATVSIVAYLGLELTALRRARETELKQEREEPAEPEGVAKREQRRSLRYSVPAEQQEATLKVGQAKLQVRLVNVSSGGFGVWAARDPGVEAGQVLWIRTDAGWDEVRVVETLAESEGHRIRLQICSAVKPWSHIREEQSRKLRSRRSRLVARLPLMFGVIVAIVVVLAPFVRNALLNKSVRAPSVAAQRGTTTPEASKRPNRSTAQASRAPGSAAAPERSGAADRKEAPSPEADERPVANLMRPKLDDEPAAVGPERAVLPDSGATGARPDDSSMVRSNLTEAINTILRDVIEETAEPPLMVQRLGEQPVRVPVVPEPGPTTGLREQVAESERALSEARASFDRGLRRFWKSGYAEAAVAFRAAIERRPDDPTYHYFLALSDYLSGRRKQAERWLARAVELEAEHPAPELGRLLQRVQGPHRRWLQAARIKARVGPYRPRR